MRFGMIVLAIVMVGGAARGSIEIVLTPEHEAPFSPGEDLDIAVGLRQAPGSEERLLRLLVFDFSSSSPRVSLNAFAYEYFPDLIIEFPVYYWSEQLPRPEAAYTAPVPIGFMFRVPGDGSLLNVGWLSVTLPEDLGEVVVVDALNLPDAGVPDHGAIIAYGFGLTEDDPYVELTPGHGLTGGRLVIPEPGSAMLLLAASAMAVYGRHRLVRPARARSCSAAGGVSP